MNNLGFLIPHQWVIGYKLPQGYELLEILVLCEYGWSNSNSPIWASEKLSLQGKQKLGDGGTKHEQSKTVFATGGNAIIVIRMKFIRIKIVIRMTLEWPWLKDTEIIELKNIKISRQKIAY